MKVPRYEGLCATCQQAFDGQCSGVASVTKCGGWMRITNNTGGCDPETGDLVVGKEVIGATDGPAAQLQEPQPGGDIETARAIRRRLMGGLEPTAGTRVSGLGPREYRTERDGSRPGSHATTRTVLPGERGPGR